MIDTSDLDTIRQTILDTLLEQYERDCQKPGWPYKDDKSNEEAIVLRDLFAQKFIEFLQHSKPRGYRLTAKGYRQTKVWL